ncbi:alpha/beta-hydrolase [Trematosphaeria pertusa]|uniref:Alpha/beta-hydrolase n=1 Tax=Trematosphaeria pertusa TaxID=390896 RepID=A0A6A6IL06_9PLEO|nr:alpha/beta-hydrolase [Trematosphaeria pertusa]KAF2250532.1 alpha/beta-hydrolase [Trematosphaeria pertusa]
MPFLEHQGANLFYTSHGSGPPALLLHGWGCDSNDWSFQIPFLTSLGLRVIALDHRGHGCSSAPADINSYAARTLVEDAIALLNHLQSGPVTLIAHSMGTVTASILAAEHPDAVKALVLVHPIYSGVPPALPRMGEAMQKDIGRAPELAVEFFEKLMYTPRTPEWLKTWQLRRLLGTDPVALAGCVVGLVGTFGSVMGQSEEARMFMRKRECPRLAVCTTVLEAEAPAGWEREVGLKEGRDKVEVLTEGVFSHMVESDKFNQVLGDWLRERSLLSS